MSLSKVVEVFKHPTAIYCVYCQGKATVRTGHVLCGTKKIVAGWCKECYKTVENNPFVGPCYGEWSWSMGLTELFPDEPYQEAEDEEYA